MNAEVVTFTADIGQGIEVNDAKKKAKKLGVKEIFVKDLSFVPPFLYNLCFVDFLLFLRVILLFILFLR